MPSEDRLPPLAEAKLAVPHRHLSELARPRVQRILAEGDGGAVTLVSAPAGYGKTTAVRAWCASLDAGLAWLTLDGGDNDPVRTWTYIATVVDRVRPGLGRRALQLLHRPRSALEHAVDALMNGVAGLERELAIALDDFHAVTDEYCLASIDYALAHLPPNARVILVTRVGPALRLGWLRAGGALTELRARELAFSPAESRELLVVHGHLELGMEQIEVLVDRTEGWPAALVVAGLWLRTVDDPASAIDEFGGTHRFVVEYLSNEVLASLAPDQRLFLYGASVLGELTPDLSDAVLGRTGSASELNDLERSNIFVARLGRGGWFRIHALFGEYARAQLAALDPEAAPRIHRRAAASLRSHDLPVEAIAHAAAAGDHQLVAEILVDFHASLIRNGAGRTFLRWARSLPDDCIVEHPEIAAVNALAQAGFVNVDNIVNGLEGDRVDDPGNVFHGKRMRNGWKNCGLPRGYDFHPDLMWESPA